MTGPASGAAVSGVPASGGGHLMTGRPAMGTARLMTGRPAMGTARLMTGRPAMGTAHLMTGDCWWARVGRRCVTIARHADQPAQPWLIGTAEGAPEALDAVVSCRRHVWSCRRHVR
jgi:hypothetical protein